MYQTQPKFSGNLHALRGLATCVVATVISTLIEAPLYRRGRALAIGETAPDE